MDFPKKLFQKNEIYLFVSEVISVLGQREMFKPDAVARLLVAGSLDHKKSSSDIGECIYINVLLSTKDLQPTSFGLNVRRSKNLFCLMMLYLIAT